MNRLCRSGVVASLLLMSVGVSSVAQAASAGGTCKAVDRTVVDSGVNLRCTQTKSGLKWRVFTSPVVAAPPVVTSQPVVAAPPAVVTPSVSVKETMLNQSGVISVTTNVVGTVYVAEVSVKVAKVSDIENAGGYLWVSAPITKVGVSEVSVDIDQIINGNYRVYVANDKGVLSAASLNMVIVSMPRLYDRVAAQSWSRQFGSSDNDLDPGVVVDASGNAFIVDTVLNSSVDNLVVKKLDPEGNQIASIEFGTAGIDAAHSVAVDGSGNVYVVGDTSGAFAANTNQGGNDSFVAKFNSSLVLQGVNQFGTAGYDVAYSVAVDGSGNVYVAGWTNGVFAANTNQGGNDGFVAKFNSSLVLQGVNQFGSAGYDIVNEVAVDGSGNVYVVGYTNGAFAGNTNQGFYDCFVAKFNSSLVLQGVNQFGTAVFDYASSVAVDGSGNVYVAGWTNGAFAGNTNQGGVDVAVMMFNSSLVLQGVNQFGTAGDEGAFSVAVNSSGNVYITGITDGDLFGSNSGEYDIFVLKEVA